MNLIEGNRVPDMGKKWQPLIPYKCDKRLTPESLKTTVLNSMEVDRICIFYSDGDATKEAQLRDVVRGLLEEIGFKRNMTTIRFLGIMLNKVLKQMSLGVYVNRKSIDLAKRELSHNRYPVLYVPCHRSYADFVLMSYICFTHDLEIPVMTSIPPYLLCKNLLVILMFSLFFFAIDNRRLQPAWVRKIFCDIYVKKGH